ncbi:MAG: ATP-dependent zinc metalloprotease FtsH [Elusimicrobiota bacterium]|nr:ATP-dependent zinc metalloprotease FtsH [Elusimicrobiota bacterium]MDH5662094.1 ATP-dependent zinc metalloprotease FtsH [Elusimicrobiota bacterium]
MNKFLKGLSLWLIIILVGMLFARLMRPQEYKEIDYSEFKSYLRSGQVGEVLISEALIKGTFTNEKGEVVKFRTVPVEDPKLVEELEAYGVKYKGEVRKNWFSVVLFNFGPILLFIFIWFMLIRSMQAGGKQAMSFGRSRAKLMDQSKQRATFGDVAGVEEAKEELQEIIAFLKDPKKFQKLGGKIPKGVLLYGAPGSGKTLLARAVAGEAGVPFFSASGSEFVEMFVGVGASRVRDLFTQGRKNAPCLMFIDELDAVGRHRFAGIGGGHDEREQTLNQLLVEMDGFDTREGVILIAATNRPDVLDPALLRPGRFDRHIMVPNPDLKGREEILKVHTRHIKLAPEVDLKVIARRTPGFVGSDIANLVNESALLAAREDKKAVGMKELEEAIDRVIAGPQRKSRMISEREKKIIAYHEAGHTLVAKLIPGTDPIHKVSIIPRGPALGYTLQLPLEDKYLATKTEITNKLTVFLGGRAAEELTFNELTTGAENDLHQATEIAHKMVCEYGMSDKVGPLTLRKKESEIFLGRDFAKEKAYSEKTAQMIDQEVKKIMEDCRNRAKELLGKNRAKLDRLAKALIEKEILVGEEVEKILKHGEEVSPGEKKSRTQGTTKKSGE